MAPASDLFAGLRQATDGEHAAVAAETLLPYVPAAFTWTELARGLAESDVRRKDEATTVEEGAKDTEPDEPQEPEETTWLDAASRRTIRTFVARTMAPILGNDDDDDDDEATRHGDRTSNQHAAAMRCSQAVADDAVAVLRWALADDDTLSPSDNDDVQVLASIIAAAEAGQPWTTGTAAAAAGDLLQRLHPQLPSADWIVDGLLNGYVRPLFARGPRPQGLTSAGRKDQYGDRGGGGGLASRATDSETRAAKPWKYGDLRAVPVFSWALQESDSALVGRHWSLFTPVLLALVDDADTDVRARGLVLLRVFVDRLPDGGRLLRQTGLDSVLAEAVLPTLLFLPRLTPEEESLQLLDPAYDALLAIAAKGSTSTSTLFDRILRDGILAGYFHASEHVRVVEVLARQAGRLVEAMGIAATKHLKDVVPLCAAILTDPFAVRHPPVLVAATATLQATLASCWPRLADSPWPLEVVRMLMLCWLNVAEADDNDDRYTQLRADLVRAADTQLTILRAAQADVGRVVGPLTVKEPQLAELFRVE
ncbi:hypothetical protein CMQ_833 [Grosmannia clavigera kw1407]|uniref:Uncharacterized protein n=1 Tax=Grosmannia clavigera (strain kw1407 / UAMH 11150) TaxID=655863 RepID=F0XEY6_GROCL|nr:uncharacterized protein CMQ_833 [Grosmannia clavigera kw1407]EFX03905.1 hypothetical protein CMQ_833 [Grosmannia clavigera kw1407]